MKLHLIRTAGVDDELFADVISLLQAIRGPIEVTGSPEALLNDSLVERSERMTSPLFRTSWESHRMIDFSRSIAMPPRVIHWYDYFDHCRVFRQDFNIPSEDLVILLTDIPNHRNWFSSMDEQDARNGFIQTSDWEYFVQAPPAFPVAYEVVALVLRQPIYRNWEQFQRNVHRESIGCINDLCTDKRQVSLKLRTADICPICIEMFQREIPGAVIDHAISIMESLRVKMLYARNLRQNSLPGRLLITRSKRIYLPDNANIKINLPPLERSLYLLFLRHPEGLLLSDLRDHRATLLALYHEINLNGDRCVMETSIDSLVNMLSNSASEKISRIKSIFRNAIGETLAENYIIRGNVGDRKRIKLDRQLVIDEGQGA